MVGASLLLISGAQAAQAPVYNLSNESVAEKLANLERREFTHSQSTTSSRPD